MNGRNQHEDLKLANAYLLKAQQARDRKIDFQISFSDYKRLKGRKKCFFTGVELIHFKETGTKQDNTYTLDRINSDLPYTKENTVPCSHWFNNFKNVIEKQEGDKLENFSNAIKGLGKVVKNWTFEEDYPDDNAED